MQTYRQKPRQGYLTLEEAVNKSNYKPDYLKQLARNGTIRHIEQDGVFYFSARSLRYYIQPSGYLTIGESAKVTGFNAAYLRRLAREKRIKSIKKRRQVFLFARDVNKLIIPEGFVTPKEAADIAGYVDEYLVNLSRREFIGRAMVHGKIYLSLEDAKKYGRDPEGYLGPEEASNLSGYSANHLRRLVKKGVIGSTLRHGIIYFSAQDVEELKVPEGFLPLEEAVRQSEFSIGQIKYQIKMDRIRSTVKHGKSYVSAEDLGIKLEMQESGGNTEDSLDARVEKLE